jgi:hypothetical protein
MSALPTLCPLCRVEALLRAEFDNDARRFDCARIFCRDCGAFRIRYEVLDDLRSHPEKARFLLGLVRSDTIRGLLPTVAPDGVEATPISEGELWGWQVCPRCRVSPPVHLADGTAVHLGTSEAPCEAAGRRREDAYAPPDPFEALPPAAR